MVLLFSLTMRAGCPQVRAKRPGTSGWGGGACLGAVLGLLPVNDFEWPSRAEDVRNVLDHLVSSFSDGGLLNHSRELRLESSWR